MRKLLPLHNVINNSLFLEKHFYLMIFVFRNIVSYLHQNFLLYEKSSQICIYMSWNIIVNILTTKLHHSLILYWKKILQTEIHSICYESFHKVKYTKWKEPLSQNILRTCLGDGAGICTPGLFAICWASLLFLAVACCAPRPVTLNSCIDGSAGVFFRTVNLYIYRGH